MTAVFPLKESFSGGELSPRLQGRVTTERYAESVDYAENWVASPQGSAIIRPGTQVLSTTKDNTYARLIPFNRGRNRDYVCEFGAEYVRVFNRNGIVQGSGSQTIRNREFNEGTNNLKYWTLDTDRFIDGNSVMNFEGISPSFVVKTVAQGDGIVATPAQFIYITQSVTVAESGPGVYPEHTFDFDLAKSTVSTPFGDAFNFWQCTVQVGDGTDPVAYVNSVETDAGYKSFTFTPTGSATVTFQFQFRVTSTQTAPNLTMSIQNLFFAPALANDLVLTTPYTVDQLDELDVAMDLGGPVGGANRLFIAHPLHPPAFINFKGDGVTNPFEYAVISFTAQPSDWTAGEYPSTVELFSGRSWWAGVTTFANRVWASKAGDYLDFTVGTNPGDPLDLLLITRGDITWLKGQKAMLIGTSQAEHTVTSNEGLAVPQVGDVDQREQSANGSIPVEPLILGNEVVYINPDQTKLYATDYVRDNDGWISTDLTWAAEHITKEDRLGNNNNKILRHSWARDPNNQLLCLMEDGTVRSLVYDPRLKVISWTRFSTGPELNENSADGVLHHYRSIAVTDDTGGSTVWYVVERDGIFLLESVEGGEQNQQYMDSYVTAATVNNVVSGLDHLNGKTVSVIVDGAVEVDKVVNNGQITTEANGLATVGLPYTKRIITLPTEGGNPRGTSQGSKMGWSKIFLRLNNSAVPQVNGTRPALRNPQTPMDTPTPRMTGDSKTYDLGRQDRGVIVIEQELPIRTEIVAIFGKLRSNEL